MSWFVSILVFLLNLFDALCTEITVSNGYAVEMNPLLVFAMKHMGSYWLIPKIGIGLFAAIAIKLGWDHTRKAKILSCCIVVFYTLLVGYEVAMFWVHYVFYK